MTYKYQLIFLGDINNNACNTIKVRFFDKIHSIGLRENIRINSHLSYSILAI